MKKKLVTILISFSFLTLLSGQTNYSLEFDGSGDHVVTSIFSDSLIVNNRITVSAWVLIDDDDDTQEHRPIIGIHPDIYFGIGYSPTLDAYLPEIGIALPDNGFEFYMLDSEDPLEFDQWVHLSMTLADTELSFYVNAELRQTVAIELGALVSTDSLSIGGNTTSFSHWNGNLDEIKIWTRLLSESDIQEAMAVGSFLYENDLLAYWNFNDGPGATILADLSNNGNHGTFPTAPNWSINVPPSLVVDPSVLQFNLLPGESGSSSFNVKNINSDTLSIQILESIGFISIGDKIENPFIVPEVPFSTVGTTAGYTDDYDEECGFGTSTSADVVYKLDSPGAEYDFTLCGNTAYDSKFYILDRYGDVVETDATDYGIACNDDYCNTPSHPNSYVSYLPNIFLDFGTYYLVVDGWSGDEGTYTFAVTYSTGQSLEPDPYTYEDNEEYDLFGLLNSGVTVEQIHSYKTQLAAEDYLNDPLRNSMDTETSGRDSDISFSPNSVTLLPGDSTDISVTISVDSDDPGGVSYIGYGFFDMDTLNNFGDFFISSIVPDIFAPDAPADLVCSPEVGQIGLSWTGSEEDILKYYIYRGTEISSITKMDSTGFGELPLYSDAAVEMDQMYYYQVSVVDMAGNESDLSAIDSASIEIRIVINEIMQNPSSVSDDNGEWFEIYNNGSVNVPLFDWTVRSTDDAGEYNSFSITQHFILQRGSYLVFGNNINSAENGGVTVNYDYGTSVGLSNSADELVLLNENAIVMDSVSWDNGETFPDPNGKSMALLDPGLDNSLGQNWQESASVSIFGDGDIGTPGLVNFYSAIDVEPNSIDFDTVYVNDTATMDLLILSIGPSPLVIDSVYVVSDQDQFSVSFATDTVVQTSASLPISFTPTVFGRASANIHIISNDHMTSDYNVSVNGFGYFSSADIAISSSSIDFEETMVGQTNTVPITIQNNGVIDLEIDTMYVSDDFTVSSSSGTVAPGDSLSVGVTFVPNDSLTTYTGSLTVVSNDPLEDTLVVYLSGSSIDPGPAIEFSDSELYFGVDLDAEDTVSAELVIYNQGLLDLAVDEIDITNSIASLNFWTEFLDAVVEPGDSVSITFYCHGSLDTYFTSVTAIATTNDGTYPLTLTLGAVAYIDNSIMEVGSIDTVDVIIQNPVTLGGLNIALGYDPEVLSFHSWTVTDRLATLAHNSDDMNLDTDNGLLDFGVFTAFGFGVSPGDGPVLRVRFSTISNSDSSTSISFEHLDVLNTAGNPIYADAPVVDGEVSIIDNPPHTPLGLGLTFDDYVILDWQENSDGDLSHYLIEKDSSETFSSDVLSTVSTTDITFTDSAFSDYAHIYYRLFAVDNGGLVSDSGAVASINLSPPLAPSGLSIEFDEQIHLSWSQNEEDNIEYYVVDRSTDSLFILDQYLSFMTADTFFVDSSFTDGSTIYYRLSAINTYGIAGEFSEIGSISISLSTANEMIPVEFALHQNYPNPFNPVTQIRYDLPENEYVSINIYDIMGRRIRSLVGTNQDPGYRSIHWDATNDLGQAVSAGMYIYTIQAGQFRQTRKMVLLK